MFGGKANMSMRMHDRNRRYPSIDESPHLRPGNPPFRLTPAPKCVAPVANHSGPKVIQTTSVAGNSIIVEVALYDRPQPSPHFGDRIVPSPAKCAFDLVNLLDQALPHRLPSNVKVPGSVALPTDMCEPKEVERLRFTRSTLLSVKVGITAELD